MKVAYCFVSVLTIISCSSTKYTKKDFIGKKYEWYASSMIGKSTIKFINDSCFVYSERDSLYVCTGTWHILTENKSILIEGEDIPYKSTLKPPIAVKLNKEFKIINVKKLKDLDLKLFEIQK